MYADFMGRAGDEIFNQLSKWQAMSAGQLTMPVVLRISVGAKYGAQHSQDWTALAHHIPGLKVVYPVTPYDAKGMMNAALAGTDPVVFFESQKVYDFGEMFDEAGVPEGYYEIELGEPSVKRTGKDLTIITFGPALYTAIAAADDLAARFGLVGRSDRSADRQPAELRAAGGFRAEDRKGAAGVRRRRARQRDADRRGEPDAACFDDLDAPPVVLGSQQLDHAGRGAGGHVLPAAGLAPGRDPRTHSAAERSSPGNQSDARRVDQACRTWHIDQSALYTGYAIAFRTRLPISHISRFCLAYSTHFRLYSSSLFTCASGLSPVIRGNGCFG